VNTGWTGGPFGLGHRIEIAYSRALLRAAMNGDLDQVETYQEPFFGLTVPTRCPGVPDKILYPQKTWADSGSYEKVARDLAGQFRKNFTKYEAKVDKAILAASPK
jgi:phosphoenolpyruvate carboxykinase (ATP)